MRWWARWMILAAALWWTASALVSSLGQLRMLLLTCAAALLTSLALEPAVVWMSKGRLSRQGATGLVLLGAVLVLVGAVVAVGAAAAEHLGHTALLVPGHLEELVAGLPSPLRTVAGHLDIAGLLSHLDVSGLALSLSSGIVTALGWAVTAAFLAYYLIVDGPRLRRWSCSLLPARHQESVLTAWTIAVDKAGGWLAMRLVLTVVTAVSSSVAFALLDVPQPVAMALWYALCAQLIPILGTYIGVAVPALLTLTDSPSRALLVVGFAFLFQTLESYILLPRLARRTMNIHPAVGLVAVLAATILTGPIGAILALPLVAVVEAFAATFLQLRRHTLVSHPALSENDGPSPANPTGS